MTLTPSVIPTHMKGIIIEENGGAEVLQYKTDIPVPVPKEDEVLIENDFIGLNYIDINFRTGLYPATLPSILGVEAAGTIVAAPATSTSIFKPGDRVVWIGTGAYAEYSTCSISKVHLLPSGLDGRVAAASLAQGLTALTFIQQAYRAQRDDWILVSGASGGVGLWLCRLLRDVGARVIGTAGSPSKMALAKENGAEFVVNYDEEDVLARIMDITAGEGVAAVFDSAGGATFDAGLKALARNGTMVVVGNASGNVKPIDIGALSAKNLRVMKPSVFGYIQTREEFVGYSIKLFDFIMQNQIDGMVAQVYPLADVAEAHADLENRRRAGKLLLKV